MTVKSTLIRTLLLFWAIWFSIVVASNAADGLLAAGILSPGWRFTSGNFSLVAEAISLYELSRTWAAVLFSLVVVVELAAASLFWRAAAEATMIIRPFLVAIALFCGFLIFDELLLVYRRFPNLESGHFVILSALLLSLLAIHREMDA